MSAQRAVSGLAPSVALPLTYGAAREQRRRTPRSSVELDVSLSHAQNLYAGLAENLSEGGIFIATHVQRRVGSTIELSIHLPDEARPVLAAGEVRWLRLLDAGLSLPPGMGIRFLEVDPSALAAIRRFLSRLAPLPHG